jgi:hypothetical protein
VMQCCLYTLARIHGSFLRISMGQMGMLPCERPRRPDWTASPGQ